MIRCSDHSCRCCVGDMRWLVVVVVLPLAAVLATGLQQQHHHHHRRHSHQQVVGDVRNLSVSLVNADRGRQLKFNVSWLPPLSPDDRSGTRQPSFYSTIVTSIPSNSNVCNEGTIYHVGESVDQTHVLLPENRFDDEDAATADELHIEPGCSYRVQVFANPRRSSRDEENSPSVTYKVPECIDVRCNCAKSSDALPTPLVTARYLNNGSALISWKVDPSSSLSLVKSYEISIGTPNLKSSSGLLVYNKTQIFSSRAEDDVHEYLWEPSEKPKRATKIFVSARDAYGCYGNEGTYVAKRPKNDTFFDKNISAIFFAGLIAICVLLSMFASFVKRLIRTRRDYKLVSALGRKSTRPLIAVLSNSKIEALLNNNNSLYVEQDGIEDVKSGHGDDPLEISYARLREVRELGSGQFGRVYLADLLDEKRRSGQILVAVKTSLDSQLEVRQQLLEEIAMIKMAGSHPHLVGLVGYSTLPNHPVCLVLEYMRGGELLSYLHRMRDYADSRDAMSPSNDTSSLESPGVDSIAETTYTTLSGQSRVFFGSDVKPEDWASNFEAPISRAEMMRFALEIAKGMEHLEAKGIVHRDLAARNVLMDENLVLKICDFGLSRKGAYMLNGAGVRRLPIRWMPPEAIRRRAFTNKSDVWSFGLCLWEIVTLGDFPYSRLSDEALLRHLLEENGRPDPGDAPTEMRELMEMCWASLPERRPNFAQIKLWLESKRQSFSKSNPMYQDVDVLKV